MMAAFRKGKTTIELGAIEPHVICLIEFLRSIGANISINYDHTIIVDGVDTTPKQAEWRVISDYIESGTFIIL